MFHWHSKQKQKINIILTFKDIITYKLNKMFHTSSASSAGMMSKGRLMWKKNLQLHVPYIKKFNYIKSTVNSKSKTMVRHITTLNSSALKWYYNL